MKIRGRYKELGCIICSTTIKKVYRSCIITRDVSSNHQNFVRACCVSSALDAILNNLGKVTTVAEPPFTLVYETTVTT